MADKPHVVVVFTFSRKVAQFINDVNALKDAVTTAPGNTRVTIAPADITLLETDLAALVLAQAKVDNRMGNAADRNLEWEKVKSHVRDIVLAVQAAADDAPDETTAIAIADDCGCKAKVRGVFEKPDFTVRLDKGVVSLIHLISKAAPKKDNPIYEWQYSLNGTSFTTIKSTRKSFYNWVSGLAVGTKVYFRKRITLNDEPGDPAWSPVISIYIQ